MDVSSGICFAEFLLSVGCPLRSSISYKIITRAGHTFVESDTGAQEGRGRDSKVGESDCGYEGEGRSKETFKVMGETLS
jgi:hypothetical protein